jgi:hypothetical protein
MEHNLKKWDMFSRALYMFVSVGFSFIALIYNSTNENK